MSATSQTRIIRQRVLSAPAMREMTAEFLLHRKRIGANSG
jgi:hypothetical protein